MDKVRYFVALLMIVSVPPAFLFWFSLHPFIRFWRRVGMPAALAIHYAGMFVIGGLIYAVGRPWLSVDFGSHPLLILLGFVLILASMILRRRLSRHLRFGILTGVPELSPDRHGTRLLTEGIYSRIRHPRYAQFFIGITGYALFCNFLATYVLVFAVALTILILVRMEERELRDRFGPEYEAYCARVPRFIPKRNP